MNEISKKQSQDYYDKEFIERQKRIGVNARHHSIFNKAKTIGLLPNHNVLEIGCGIGTLSSLLIPYLREGSIFCCDLSSESIKYAEETYKNFLNVEFQALDASDFVLDRKFDMVIMPDVCEHIPIELHNRMFKNISKMLKREGVVYIHIPAPYYLDWAKVYSKEELQIIDQSLYLDEFCERIKDTDFYVYSEEPYNVWYNPALGEWKGKYVHRILRKKIDFTTDDRFPPKIVDNYDEIRGELEKLEKFIASSPSDEIVKNASYVLERIKTMQNKMQSPNEQTLAPRIIAVLEKIKQHFQK